MKKTVKTILAVVLLLIFYSLFKKDPLDKVEFTNDINDVVTPIVIEKPNMYEIDFSECIVDDGFVSESGGVTNKIKVIEKAETECIVETSFSSTTGFYVNKCRVPIDMGLVKFDGNNFNQISQYCEISSTGEGLLELN